MCYRLQKLMYLFTYVTKKAVKEYPCGVLSLIKHDTMVSLSTVVSALKLNTDNIVLYLHST